MLGSTFGEELFAAGLGGLPICWDDDGVISDVSRLTVSQQESLRAVVAAHDPKRVSTRAQITALEETITTRMWREASLGAGAIMRVIPETDPRNGKTASQYIAWVDAQCTVWRKTLTN